MKKLFPAVTLALLSISLCFKTNANGLTVSDLTWYYESQGSERISWCVATIKWDNAWNTPKNHDGAWLFLKFVRPGSQARHAFLAKDGVRVITDHSGKAVRYTIKISDDQTGFFIYPSDRFRGNVHLTVRINIDMARSGNLPTTTGVTLSAYGVEMVNIPSGSFFIGESDSSAARRFQTFYNSDVDGKHKGVYELTNEDKEINVGKGSLYYEATETIYQGDMKGMISKSFPKGVNSFWCMKYELNQGQYADFLNAISAQQNTVRSNIGGSMYYQLRGTIRFDDGKYFAEMPQRPCNFISWDDAMAYADWACLRPMTEFEFTKAARGTDRPSPNSFPWGNGSKEKVQRIVNNDGDLVLSNGIDEAQLNDNNKEIFGASYYWVMDLAGSLWERVITAGDEKGRAFTGGHGDGSLSTYGSANVAGWPQGNDETGGFGFRGGGFYSHDRSYHEFNPYSPVSYRRFAAWSGGARVESYGSRFVRTE